MECLKGYPRIRGVDFDIHGNYYYNDNFIKTQFNKDLDVGILAKWAGNIINEI